MNKIYDIIPPAYSNDSVCCKNYKEVETSTRIIDLKRAIITLAECIDLIEWNLYIKDRDDRDNIRTRKILIEKILNTHIK